MNPPLASILKSPPLVWSPVPTLATIIDDSQVATTRAVVDVVLGEGEEQALLDVVGFGVGKSSILNEDGDGGVREGVRWTERRRKKGRRERVLPLHLKFDCDSIFGIGLGQISHYAS